jgi:transposase
MKLTEIKKFEIIVHHNNGMSIRKIAEKMNINPKTVHLWILRYKSTGNLNHKQKNGTLREKINNQ